MRFMDDEYIIGPKEFAVGNYLVQMVSIYILLSCINLLYMAALPFWPLMVILNNLYSTLFILTTSKSLVKLLGMNKVVVVVVVFCLSVAMVQVNRIVQFDRPFSGEV